MMNLNITPPRCLRFSDCSVLTQLYFSVVSLRSQNTLLTFYGFLIIFMFTVFRKAFPRNEQQRG